jgi:S1-C subfamily serine protease
MRQHEQIAGRIFALGMVAIAGLVGMLPWSAMSQEPPPGESKKAARQTAGQQSGRAAPRDDSATPAQARPVELANALVARCKAATALVELRAVGSGSAACVSTEGFFVTNHHVVADAGLGHDVRVVVYPGQIAQKVLNARVIKLDEENDLALLKVDASPQLLAIPLGTDDNLVETMTLAAFGYPFGRMLASDIRYPAVSVNAGTVTALRKKAGKLSSIQLDAAVNPGNSGGPVVDKEGKLIGIVNSGIPGARLNFAIPVTLVRAFLAGPALVLRDPGVTFAERTKPHQFEIDAYAFDRRDLDDVAVELSLTGSADDTRTFQAKRIGDRFVAVGPACSPAGAPAKPVLVVHKGRGQIKSTVPPGEVSFGRRKFSWLAIDSLEKDGDLWVLSLLDNERFAGQPRALPSVSYGAGRTTQLATADRIELRLENPPPTEVTYEIQAHRDPTVFTPIRGRLRIKETPRGLTPGFGQPIDRTQIDVPIVIEGVVRETLIVGVAPTGLVWSPVQGAPAGMEDESGRYLLVNGQPWRAAAGPSVLPILLGVRAAQIQLLWARPVGDGPHNAERVSADVQKVPMANLTSMIVRNRAAEPSRVALAITFDPPKMIDPIMPPRSRPVLESHWPLNDDDPARAADIGPAKCAGHTSVAHMVPGTRDNGLQIDRQAVVCADALPIDRNDAFSCSAWMKPARAGDLTLLSRMNSGLRGFDLNYTGSLQAHIISSWDGSAIRVCTIERFDSTQWHHVAVTYDGSSRSRGWKIYLDGALATLQVTVDRLNDTIHSDFPFAIGARERRDYYQGQVDEVRTYNRVLTDDEVFDLYDRERSNLDPATGSTLTQGLVGHWSFDASSAEGFKDKSGNGHDGKPESDLGLPEIVESDGSQAVRLGGLGTVDCGAVANFDRSDPYSLGAWIKPRGDGLRTVLSSFDVFERGFELAFDGHVICDLISEWEGSAILIKTRSVYPNDAWHHATAISASVREPAANILTVTSTTRLSTSEHFPRKRLKPGSCAGEIPWGRCRRLSRAG